MVDVHNGNSFVTILLARAGSKGIPNKNHLEIAGKSLFEWTIKQLKEEGIECVYVSTDSPRIKEVAEGLGCQVINRPDYLAGDDSSGDSALIHAAREISLDAETTILNPQLTSPLRPSGSFRNCLSSFFSQKIDSIFSAVQMDDICVWELEPTLRPLTYVPSNRLPRQKVSRKIVENGSIYAIRAGVLRDRQSKIGTNPGFFLMPKWTLPELDEIEDINLVETLIKTFVKKGRS